MSRHAHLFLVASLMTAMTASNLSAQCEGGAMPGTTYTQHTDCFNPSRALQWTLSVACLDACGEVWWTLPSKDGSVDGACNQPTWEFCSPQWYRYNYSNGMYAETSAFGAYLFAGCRLRDVPVTTAGDCPCAPPCEPEGGGGGGPKGPCSTPVPGETAVLSVRGPVPGDMDSIGAGLFSGRSEEVEGLRYVMEDWAVIGVDAWGGTRVLARGLDSGSWPLPAPKRFASLGGEYGLALEEPESIRLVIAPPFHPHNSRHIPRPSVAMPPARLDHRGDRVTAAVRIDVGEDRLVRDAKVLYSVGRLPSGIDLAAEVRDHLRVRYASEQQHRVIVFAIVDVESGMMYLRDSAVVLPLCCCYPLCK